MATPINSTALRKRAALLASLRRALDVRDFIEVTTPVMLKVAPGGPAASHPFEFDGGRYDLRTSIELLLRTALRAERRVYDIGPAIRLQDRTKGSRSAAEFTLMECFAADLNYEGLLCLAEELILEIKPSLSEPVRISVVDWFAREWGINFDADVQGVRKSLCAIVGVADTQQPLWVLIDQVISAHLEPALKGFVFLTEYPIETICLANRAPDAPHVAQRFEVYLNGIEIGHGFVDSADPEDVLKRMMENGKEFVDSDFIEQMRSGLLPAASAGFGLGIERLLACDDDPLDVQQYLHEYQHA